MVLGPFAETKGPRRAGAKPRENLSLLTFLRKQESSVSESLSLLLSVIPDPDRGSRQGKNPGSLCSCRGGISCRPKRPPRNGQRHETEGRMRCGHYRGGVPGGIRGRGCGRGGERATEGGIRCGLGRRHEMPPLQKRGRGRNPACSFCHSERSACPESFEGKNLSLNNRTPGKADSFLRQTLRKTQGVLRTGATLGMTMLVYCRR